MKRPLAYITAHWGDNEFENTENAAKYCRLVYEAGFSPVCPLLFLPLFLKDSIPQEHKHRRSRAAADHRHHPGRYFDGQGPGPRGWRQKGSLTHAGEIPAPSSGGPALDGAAAFILTEGSDFDAGRSGKQDIDAD